MASWRVRDRGTVLVERTASFRGPTIQIGHFNGKENNDAMLDSTGRGALCTVTTVQQGTS